MAGPTLYWHDYETFGIDPQWDRPVQFAGVRTDYDFNAIDDPLVIYCKPSEDYLPDPESCAITGITPQLAVEKGASEAEFIARILEKLLVSNTCVLGYNSIRFDDEVTRNTLYRNLYDPYQREWQNGNSRWDLIDVVRSCYALRPEGIEWPLDDAGSPVFRLEVLTQANGIQHQAAHDALSDVYATIALAKLIRQAQPKLYQFLFDNRSKKAVSNLINLGSNEPLIHISGRYSAAKKCAAVILPICEHPANPNGVLVYDLSIDPEPLLALTPEEIKQRIFVANDQLAAGVARIPLKTIHLNKCPVLAPIKALRPSDATRLSIDLGVCLKNAERLSTDKGLAGKLSQVFSKYAGDNVLTDPDLMIYSGGFFSPGDRQLMQRIHDLPPQDLGSTTFPFKDSRLKEMLFRFRARNYPETLSHSEMDYWRKFCYQKLMQPNDNHRIGLDAYFEKILKLISDGRLDQRTGDELTRYGLNKRDALQIDN
ncbi:exodeoxyribonuclease I [Methylicorpusculum sp.]|uniref:exodeoxyribonuclease I n=2 Tax=Methylicorpusculum sp. TaxID=2713644 RepID=UPI002731EC2F|nr:exodeoxyribonuclease I [Methylicorpusculum sp.]MDP2177964.1 exodeoxyribonuclease I [Methylicorpusculum sp.]MDP3529655.1 exodeoxyribonuclease I [Methylicorpusculum sp.]